MACPTSPGVASTVATQEELQDMPLALAVGPGGTLTIATRTAILQLPPNGVLSLLAGDKNTGPRDGQGSQVFFHKPFGLAVDQQGTVTVADTFNHRICRISPEGVVSTLAGSNTEGFADGQGAAASFNFLRGVALDPRGNIIVADTSNNAIRMVTPQGLTSTLGGSQMAGFRDGPLSQALFNNPWGVAVDQSGTIFVADCDNHCIRKISVQGVVSTLAGSGSRGHRDGQGTAAAFTYPRTLALDRDGGLVVTDQHCVRTVSQEGVVCTVAGSGTLGFRDGPSSEASFYNPLGVAVDREGSLLIADFQNGALRRVTRPISPDCGVGVAMQRKRRQPDEKTQENQEDQQRELEGEQKRQGTTGQRQDTAKEETPATRRATATGRTTTGGTTATGRSRTKATGGAMTRSRTKLQGGSGH